MIKNLSILLTILMFGCTFQANIPKQFSQAAPPTTTGSVFNAKEAYDSVGRIFVKVRGGSQEISCSAFALDDNMLISAGHCGVAIYELQIMGILAKDIQLEVLTRNNKLMSISGLEIVEIDEPHDIAVFVKKNHGLKPVKFASAEPQIGDEVHIVGAPLGFMVADAPGTVMDPTMSTKGYPFKNHLLISSAAAGGNSGSAVFNAKNELVGILVMGFTNFDHLSICVRLSTVKRFLTLVGLKWQ